MPQLGETEKGKNYLNYIWHACIDCGKERRVRLVKGKPEVLLCYPCTIQRRAKPLGKKNPRWKGGRRIKEGYILIKLFPDDFFYPMAQKNGYVFEHRLVVAKALNRCLLSWEVVHHKGTKYPKGSIENRSDNRLENLELLPSDKSHIVDRVSRSLIARLEKRVILLEAENILLQDQIKQFQICSGQAMLRR